MRPDSGADTLLPMQPHRRFTHARVRIGLSRALAAALPAGLVLALPALASCGSLSLLSNTQNEFVSDEQPYQLSPRLTTRLFDYEDNNTADIVLSDLDPETLADADAWQGATGQVIHARMFVQPRPGRTPIEKTACTVTLRYLVLAGEGEYGIYAGGGFLIPDGAPDGDRFSGSIHNASLRLVSATPGFKDLIGRGTLGLDFRAKRDQEGVRRATRNADYLAFGALPTESNPLLVNEE
jgi:hypothetical protein